MNNAKRSVEEELEEAKTQAILLHPPVLEEEVAKQWFRAVADGNETKVAELLAAHPAVTDMLSCVETTTSQGYRLSHVDYSSSMRHRGDATNTGCCCTALLLAAGRGHDKIVELLLAAKSSVVDATDYDGSTALHYAAKCTSSDKNSGPFLRVVKLLLAACPTLLDVVDGEGHTALLCAVKQKKEAIVNELLLAAANNKSKSLDAEGSCGMNVLHHAIHQQNEALVWRLLELKPELIHRVSANGFTPLHMSIQWSLHVTSPLSRLHDMRAGLFRLCPQVATDYDKEYLLRVAVGNDFESDLDLYLPHSTFDQVVAAFRAMPDKKSPEGRLRPLIDAQCGPLSMLLNQDVMRIVYEYLFLTQRQRKEGGEETEDRNQQKERWIAAVKRGDKELVLKMLSGDPSLIEVGARRGDTALHLAVVGGNSSIVELLLAASPTLGLLGNNHGKTALMCAAMRDDARVTEMLIAACPDSLDLVDRIHGTALLHASLSGEHTMDTILAANPKNFEPIDIWGYNVLHHAIRYERVERVEKLLELDPNIVCNLTWGLQTPLWLAVEKGANKLIKRLFDMFPQALRMAAEDGLTAYDLAARNKNDFAVDFFMPKLTFEENVCSFRKFPSFFDGCGKRLRSVIDVQCEDVAKVLNNLTLMNTIYSFLGFGTCCVLKRQQGMTKTPTCCKHTNANNNGDWKGLALPPSGQQKRPLDLDREALCSKPHV